VIIVNSLTSVTPACPWQVAGGPTGGVPNPPPVQWSFDVLIPRPVDAIARALDPQSWPKCNPFFQETYLAATSSSCCSKATTATSAMTATCTPKLGPTGDPQAASAEPVGKPYGPTALYEHACIADDCSSCPGPTRCDVDFANLLCIDTHYDKPMPFSCMTSSANRYDVGYKLASWLRGELLGQEQQQITDDHGGLSATRATDKEKVGLPGNDWSVVHVDKTLDFQDSNVTGAVGKYMQALRDELAWQIAEHACCDVAKECWLFAW